jgi:ankyrin repeat protein
MLKYRKIWLKRSLSGKSTPLEHLEEMSALQLLCENLLSDDDRRLLEEIMMDDVMEKTLCTSQEATYEKLVEYLQGKEYSFKCYLRDGSTPLHAFTKLGFSECVRVLIQSGVDVNAVHAQLGHSAVHIACMVGSEHCLHQLLLAGADRAFLNTMNGKRRSALHYASEQGSYRCLQMLLSTTPAIKGSHLQKQHQLDKTTQDVKKLKSLLDVQDNYGNTACHLACIDGNEQCVKLLIDVRMF